MMEVTMQGRVVMVRDGETFTPQNDVEAFFAESLEFLTEKVKEACTNPHHTFHQTGGNVHMILMCLISNIALNMLFPAIKPDLDYATRQKTASLTMDSLKEMVMASWERVELMKFKDDNAH